MFGDRSDNLQKSICAVQLSALIEQVNPVGRTYCKSSVLQTESKQQSNDSENEWHLSVEIVGRTTTEG